MCQLRACCLFVFLTLLPGCVPDREHSEERLNGLLLQQRILQAANEGMGWKKIQDQYNEIGRFTTSLPDWPMLTEKLASKTGEQFGKFLIALNRLRETIENHYDSTSNESAITGCCQVNTTRFHKNFGAVDTHRMCTRQAPDAESPLNLPGSGFLRKCRENLQQFPIIKWQYFGTEEGGTGLYPAFKIECDYRPRIRPWYVETFAPIPKDIVIVVDATRSAYSNLVKQSVLTIIGTTNPTDRIGIVNFGEAARTPEGSTDNSTCYSSKLAVATPRNKNYLMWVVNKEAHHKKNEASNYVYALKKAFDLFNETKDISRRNSKVLLFFSHSNPTDPVLDSISSEAKRHNALLTSPATILTFGAGNELDSGTEKILKDLANIDPGGSYTRLNSTKNLRYNLGAYYKTLSQPTNRTLFVLPYVDLWNLGLVISMCQPFFSQSKFKGVVCIDGRVRDLLSDVTDLHQGVDTYAFITCKLGRIIHHPALAQPDDKAKSNLNAHISMLERGNGVHEILAGIRTGKPGGKSIRVTVPKGKATHPGQWVQPYQVTKHYEWAKIPNTGYMLCIVSTEKGLRLNLNVPRHLKASYLHPLHIKRPENKQCLHDGSRASMYKSSVTLGNKTYFKDCGYTSYENEASGLSSYFSHFPNAKHHCLRDYVYKDVLLTGLADPVWTSKQSQKYNRIIRWRHLVTVGGVRRIYPAVQLKSQCPLTLPWYVKALTESHTIILTREISTKRSTITLSRAITGAQSPSRPSGYKVASNQPIAVLAAEFSCSFWMRTITHLFPSCQGEKYSCFLLDESGMVLFHTNVDGSYGRKLGHIIDMEGDIAQYLITKGHLVSGECVNVELLKTQKYWKIYVPGGVLDNLASHPSFELQVIPYTNAFIVRKRKMTGHLQISCSKPCINMGKIDACHRDWGKAYHRCDCPCLADLNFDFCKYAFSSFDVKHKAAYTCPLSVQPLPVQKVQSQLSDLPECVPQPACSTMNTHSDCDLVPHCVWCHTGVDHVKCVLKSSCNIHEGPKPTTTAIIVIAFFVVIIGLIVLILCLWKKGHMCKIYKKPRFLQHLEPGAQHANDTANPAGRNAVEGTVGGVANLAFTDDLTGSDTSKLSNVRYAATPNGRVMIEEAVTPEVRPPLELPTLMNPKPVTLSESKDAHSTQKADQPLPEIPQKTNVTISVEPESLRATPNRVSESSSAMDGSSVSKPAEGTAENDSCGQLDFTSRQCLSSDGAGSFSFDMEDITGDENELPHKQQFRCRPLPILNSPGPSPLPDTKAAFRSEIPCSSTKSAKTVKIPTTDQQINVSVESNSDDEREDNARYVNVPQTQTAQENLSLTLSIPSDFQQQSVDSLNAPRREPEGSEGRQSQWSRSHFNSLQENDGPGNDLSSHTYLKHT